MPLPNGEGVFTFSDGSVYTGSFVDGKPNGSGKFKGSTGEVMEGTFRDGTLHGKGYVAHDDLETIGHFDNGVLHHTGLRLFEQQVLHEGSWDRGELVGRCVMQSPKLDFTGFVERGCPHGHGFCTYMANLGARTGQQAGGGQVRGALEHFNGVGRVTQRFVADESVLSFRSAWFEFYWVGCLCPARNLLAPVEFRQAQRLSVGGLVESCQAPHWQHHPCS